MKVKKIVTMLLSASMMLGAMGSCQVWAGDEEEPYVIRYYCNNDVFDRDEEVFAAANEYIMEKIGCTVDFIKISPSEYTEKMKMIFASGEEFDMCFVSSAHDFYTNVENGVYLPMEDLLKEQGKDIYELTPDYYFDTTTVNGHIYGLPYLKDAAVKQTFRGKTYLCEKYGIDVNSVKILEDLTPILQTIKDNEPEYVPMLMKGTYTLVNTLPYEIINSTNVLGFARDSYDEVINIFEQDDMMPFLKLMREWNQKGFFPADVETLTTLGDYASSGLYFGQIVTYSPYAELKTEEATSGTENLFDVSVTFEDEAYLPNGNLFGAGMAISATSQNPEKTMEFINLINTDSYLRNLIAYGIEGEHYQAVGDNQWTFMPGAETKGDASYNTQTWTQGNSYILKVQDNQPADYWEKYKEYNESATPSGALGFIPDISNLTTELAAIANVYNEYAPSILTGAVDPEENLPKFLEKLNAVGLQDVQEEINNQYQEWKAAK